jgi:hypothetical protein
MKWIVCAASAALSLATLPAAAAPAARNLAERSPDVLAPAQLKKRLT